MKTPNRFFAVLTAVLVLFATFSFAQEDDGPSIKYYVAVTYHWNMDYEDFDMDTWKAVEQEFLEKVTKKNEHILASSVYLHHTTPDNSELMVVQGYASWDAIEKASDRNGELINEAWPDEAERNAYFDKRQAYYSAKHSDEIYAASPGAKYFAEDPTDGMILHLRKSYRAYPEDGSAAEWNELRDTYIENIINKNELIKAWFPAAHYYGGDSTERVTATFFDSMADFDAHYDRNGELAAEAWDEETRKDRGQRAAKYWTGYHGDYIYTFVGGLSK
jgi:hypothetical protein